MLSLILTLNYALLFASLSLFLPFPVFPSSLLPSLAYLLFGLFLLVSLLSSLLLSFLFTFLSSFPFSILSILFPSSPCLLFLPFFFLLSLLSYFHPSSSSLPLFFVLFFSPHLPSLPLPSPILFFSPSFSSPFFCSVLSYPESDV